MYKISKKIKRITDLQRARIELTWRYRQRWLCTRPVKLPLKHWNEISKAYLRNRFLVKLSASRGYKFSIFRLLWNRWYPYD